MVFCGCKSGKTQKLDAVNGTRISKKRVLKAERLILFSATFNEDSLASQSQPDNAAPNEDSWALPEITGRAIIPMASEEELEELQDMVDELLNSDGTEGQTGPGMVLTFPICDSCPKEHLQWYLYR